MAVPRVIIRSLSDVPRAKALMHKSAPSSAAGMTDPGRFTWVLSTLVGGMRKTVGRISIETDDDATWKAVDEVIGVYAKNHYWENR